MLLLHEKYKPVVRVLLNAGCCCRCVLRFCCVAQQAPYKLPYEELVAELDQFASITVNITSDKPAEDVGPPCKKAKLEETKQGVEETQQNGEVHPHPGNADSGSFKRHLGTCVVCLGILQQCCQKEFADQVCEKVNSAGYEFDSVAFSVSLPPQFSVREHAVWLFIKQKVGQQLLLKKEEIVQLKDVYKWIIHPLLSEELGVPMDSKSLFEVSVVFAHPKTDGDCLFLATFCPDCFRPAKNKQSVFTRMAVVKALEKIKDEDFCKHFPCPPPSSEMGCVAEEIQCAHAPVYIAGRYNKYSRTLPQTPWIIDGERKMESSVEELISEHLIPAFKVSHFNFSSSGREDVDVRTLGKGRPFAIEFVNPHRASFTQEEIKVLQQKINQSDKIKVRDLQMVTREAMAHMKKGEEEKTKSYSALIWTERAIQENDIQFLNELKELKIFQKTPLRVLHRRPLAIRDRLIHTMRAEYIDQHHFRFYLKTQAGTYIKEFVHGDFGRTKPNLGLLMKTTADILELDVESVDVDWPPALDN